MKRKKQISEFLLATVLVMVAVSGCGDSKSSGGISGPEPVLHTDLSAAESNGLLSSSPQIMVIDVASFADYWPVHIFGAYNYSFENGEFQRIIPALDKEITYLIYARNTANSLAAVEELTSAGFANVYRMVDNFSVWINAGFPVTVPLPP